MTTIQEIIDNLYITFSRYEFRGPLSHHYCYIPEERWHRLHTQVLRQLTAADLDDYAFSPCSEENNFDVIHNYKHFLPRMLELATYDPYFPLMANVGFGTIFEKFTYGFSRWSQEKISGWSENLSTDEKLLLEQYLQIMWETAVVSDRDISYHLYALALVYKDLRSFLDKWLILCEQSTIALLQLTAFISHIGFYNNKLLIRGFIADIAFTKWHVGVIVNWLLEPAVLVMFENAFFKYDNAPIQDTSLQPLLEKILVLSILIEPKYDSINDQLLAVISQAITDLNWIREVYTGRFDVL